MSAGRATIRCLQTWRKAWERSVYVFIAVNLIYFSKQKKIWTDLLSCTIQFSHFFLFIVQRGEKRKRSNKSTFWRKKVFVSNIFCILNLEKEKVDQNTRLKDHTLVIYTYTHAMLSIFVQLYAVSKLFNTQLSSSLQQWQSQWPLKSGEYLILSSYLNNAAWKN